MRADGTETFASLLSAIVTSARHNSEAAGEARALMSRLLDVQSRNHAEMMTRLGEILSATKAAPTPSSPLSVEALAKIATNLTTIGGAVAKAWGPALAFVAVVWKFALPWLRQLLGL